MSFTPSVGYKLEMAGSTYSFAEHPHARGMTYGQEGRQAVVYQLISGSDRRALKVFKSRYREPALVTLAQRLSIFGDMPGLQVCWRAVLTPQRDAALLTEHPDLIYALLMPWIEGPTWMEVILSKRELTLEESKGLARVTAEMLARMEQRGVTHGDLSGSNVLLPAFAVTAHPRQAPVELVDVEQFYGPGLDKPSALTAGSMGYTHRSAPEGLWGPNGDRFAGAVLLAEMLGWCDESIREAAWGEGYFDPDEMQQEGDRYRLLVEVLKEIYGNKVAGLFEQVWSSDSLAACPTFGEWVLCLPEKSPRFAPSSAADSKAKVARDSAMSNESRINALLEEAHQMETRGDLKGALQAYQEALPLAPSNSGLHQELILITRRLEARLIALLTESRKQTREIESSESTAQRPPYQQPQSQPQSQPQPQYAQAQPYLQAPEEQRGQQTVQLPPYQPPQPQQQQQQSQPYPPQYQHPPQYQQPQYAPQQYQQPYQQPYQPQQMPPGGYPQPQYQYPHSQQTHMNVTVNNTIGQAQAAPVVVMTQSKSVFVAFLLTFFLGPLGMFYSTVGGAVIMLIISVVLGVLTLGLSIFITWPICIIWGMAAASSSGRATVVSR